MADKSAIEWTDATWNPTVGCAIVSPGCTHCYAMRMAARCEAMGAAHYAGTTKVVNGHVVWTGQINAAPDPVLTQPLRWKRPRRIFVNSMSDLFAEGVDDATIDKVFAVMALAPQHTFQVLTKRPERMRTYLRALYAGDRHVFGEARDIAVDCELETLLPEAPDGLAVLPNVVLGVSVEDQDRADERIPILLETPAAKRFISAEPLLGALNLRELDVGGDGEMDALNPAPWAHEIENWRDTADTWEEDFLEWYNLAEMPTGAPMHPTLDWVIVGGESGPGARPMRPDWPRQIRDDCAAAGVPFFFKQWGEWHPMGQTLADGNVNAMDKGMDPDRWRDDGCMVRVGKRAAGRRLDGVEHDGFPA